MRPETRRASASCWRTVPTRHGHALPAGLVAEEGRDALQEARQVDAVVQHQHDARAERRLGLARALERERQVELVGPQEAAGRDYRHRTPAGVNPASTMIWGSLIGLLTRAALSELE